MRAFVLFVALSGCGFTGSSGGGGNDPQQIDAPTPSDDAPRIVDAPASDIDAPPPIDAPPAANNCGAGYVTVAGAGTSTYRKVNTPAQWAAAVTDCGNDGNGAHLVIPANKDEAEVLHAFVAPEQMSPYYWAGISEDDPNDWEDVFGVDYPNPPWAPNEPDNDKCVLIGSTGAFYDFSCGASQEYLCECPEDNGD